MPGTAPTSIGTPGYASASIAVGGPGFASRAPRGGCRIHEAFGDTQSQGETAREDWVDLANTEIEDSSVCTIPITLPSKQSELAKFYNFDFSAVDDDESVVGIVIKVVGRMATSNTSTTTVRLLDHTNAMVGTDFSGDLALPVHATNEGTILLGSATGLEVFGSDVMALTTAQIKNSNFGVAMKFESDTGDAGNLVVINYIGIMLFVA